MPTREQLRREGKRQSVPSEPSLRGHENQNNSRHMERLGRQEKYLDARKAGVPWKEAATIAGVAEATVKWWRRGVKFRAEDDNITRRERGVQGRVNETLDGAPFPDFLEFRETYFGHKTFWYAADAYDKLQRNDRLVALWPPNHGKTTFLSIEYATYLLIRSAATDPERGFRITVIQKSQDEAKKVVRAVKERLGDHGFYQRLGIPEEEDPITRWGGNVGFKPQRGDNLSWGAESFWLAGTGSGEKDPSLQAKGATSTIVGNRADLIIVDDPQDPTDSSPASTDRIARWLQQEVLSRLGQKSRVVFLGSRIGPEDIWSRILTEEWASDWPVVRYPAVLNEKDKRMLCPDLWTWPTLMRAKKEAGSFWFSTWMQEEGVDDTATFQRPVLEAAREEDLVLGERPPQVTDVFLGIDPAITNFCAMVVWGLDRRTGQRYLIDVFNEKGLRTFQNVHNAALDLAGKFSVGVCAIEMNNVQAGIANDPDFVRAMRSMGTRVTTYITRTEMGARAEHDSFSISTIGGLFDEGLITLPYGGDKRAREQIDAYINQLVSWRPGVKYLTRDMVMATLFAESEAMPVAQRARMPQHRHRSRAPDWTMDAEGRFLGAGRFHKKKTSDAERGIIRTK